MVHIATIRKAGKVCGMKTARTTRPRRAPEMSVAKAIADKLAAWREHDGLKQTEVAALTGIEQGRISDLESQNGSDNNLNYMIRIRDAMRAKGHAGAGLDWLIEPGAAFPPPEPGKAVVLTEGEAEVLYLARKLCRREDGTIDPALTKAERRLLADHPSIPIGEVKPDPGKSAVEEERREREDEQRRRNKKGRA
jgi:predicted XRE-type DNA-binding protein